MKRLILSLAVLMGLAGSSQAQTPQDPEFQKKLAKELIQLFKDMDNRIQKLEDKTVFRHHQPSYTPPSYATPTYATPAPSDYGPPMMMPEERFFMAILLIDQWLGKLDRKLAGDQPGYTPRPSLAPGRLTGDTAGTVVKNTTSIDAAKAASGIGDPYRLDGKVTRQTGGTTAVAKSTDLYRAGSTYTAPTSTVAPLYTADKKPGNLDENRTTGSSSNPLHLGDGTAQRKPGDLGENTPPAKKKNPLHLGD